MNRLAMDHAGRAALAALIVGGTRRGPATHKHRGRDCGRFANVMVPCATASGSRRILLPATNGIALEDRRPVILERTQCENPRCDMTTAFKNGYIVILQDVRGRCIRSRWRRCATT